jgi:N-acetylmuramoyl-L-alanine amidase
MEPGNRISQRILATGSPVGVFSEYALAARIFSAYALPMCIFVMCILPSPSLARTVQQKKQAAALQFQSAERMRQSLRAKPESRRTREDYQRVLDSYRKVYHAAPNAKKAEPSIFAVAELLEEQGRLLDDPKSFKDAIGQLEFLRREYPGSTLRGPALFTIARIYRDDLDDSAQAEIVFQDFLKHYPKSTLAARAHDELEDIATGEKEKEKEQTTRSKSSKAEAAANATTAEKADKAEKNEKSEKLEKSNQAGSEHHRPILTGIRHWSTPDYTRVAIDLEAEVEYEAGRVPHPDRIFFDLHGAKVASALVGKSFVVDDGFLHKIRVAQYKANLARVVLDVDDVAEYSAFLLPNPYRLIIDIHGKKTVAKTVQHVASPSKSNVQVELPARTLAADGVSSSVSAQTPPPASTETVASTSTGTQPASDRTADRTFDRASDRTTVVTTEQPKLEDSAIDQKERTTSKPTSGPTFESVAPKEPSTAKPRGNTKATLGQTAHAAAPTADGERSLIRALGLKIGRIVIDAGHGGHDAGTIGPNGLLEKDLVLDVALKLGKLLQTRLGAQVVYTRDDDTFIPLETRTAIANKEQADLFISVHANSSSDPSARGVETYYLNFTSSSDALEVAARENAVSEKSIHELQDLVKKIALREKIEESREFALDVQKSLYGGLAQKSPGLQDRGVKKAPFIVLIGANMPSILAEISFVSNPTDEKKLQTEEYRRRIAESLYRGVAKYVNGLSGVKVASKSEGAERPATEARRPAPTRAGDTQ